MSNVGKYVRAIPIHDDQENQNVEEVNDEAYNVGRYVRAPVHCDQEEINDDQNDCQYDHYESPYTSDRQEDELRQRISELEKTIAELAGKTRATENSEPDVSNEHQNHSEVRDVSTPMGSEGCTPSIRWDQMKPFPKGIPANKMWEAWTKYKENFEIAASLSNIRDPVQRVNLLFLSMGDELQGIVRAAKLRPSLVQPGYYETFTTNIDQYLKSLTDTSAEHDAFSCMQQEEGESAVSFHARLMEKVWLCGYSPSDQERFVRAQLLKGLRNQDLAKMGRVFGYETNFIVQSAARDEAFPVGAVSTADPNILAVDGMQHRISKFPYKRRDGDRQNSGSRFKQFRSTRGFSRGRRERCSRCYNFFHTAEPCPALKKNCNSCGQRGHFAAACRKNRTNAVENSFLQPDVSKKQNEEQVNS